MTPKTRRLLSVLVLSSCIGLVGVAASTYATWPANTLGVYLHQRRARQQNIHALEGRVAGETDPLTRRFYQAWLAEEKGDMAEAIRGFESLQAAARPGTTLHLRSSLRLGLAHGANHDPEKELATYQGLMARYPGPSLLSQAMFHLRKGQRERARVLLDEAIARDTRDGSLGSDRQLATTLRNGLGPAGARSAP
ncbi:MAG TPA: hypothetical protein VLT62_25910 [Candidatus Methylomirabilis sp.]|nr:hypothetical protein [Candidatus Methylomirabilis sp.]